MIGMQAKASSEQQTLQQSSSHGASVAAAAATTFYEHSIAEESSSSSDDENDTFERTLEDDTSLESLIPSDSENEDYDEDGSRTSAADGLDTSTGASTRTRNNNTTGNNDERNAGGRDCALPYNYYQFPYYGSALARPSTSTTTTNNTSSNAAPGVTHHNTNNSNSTTGITSSVTVDNNKLPVSSSANPSTEPEDTSTTGRRQVAATAAAVSLLEEQRQFSLSMVYSDDSGEREHKQAVRNPSSEGYEGSEHEDEEFTVYWQRWLMLFYMSMLNLLSDWTCYSVAPISVLTSQTFGQIEPTLLVTLFLSANAIATALEPMILSRFGLRGTILLGSFLLLVGSLTKSGIPFLASIIASQNQEWKVYLGFFLVGLSQPLYQCTPALLSNSWFPEKERTLATGVSLNANQLGIGCAFVFGTILVKTAQDIPRYFSLMSFLAMLLFIGCLLQFDDAPPTPPSGSARIIRGTLTINLPKHFFRRAFGTDSNTTNKNNSNNNDANKIVTSDNNTPPDSQLIPGATTSITANLRQRGASSPSQPLQQQDHPRHTSSSEEDDSGEEQDALWQEEDDKNYQSNPSPPVPMYPSPYYWGYPTPPHVANYYGEQAANEQFYYSQPHQQPHFIHRNHNTFHHSAGEIPLLPYSPRFSDYYYEDDQHHPLHLPPTMYDYDEGAEPVEIVEPHKISIDIRDDQILLSAKACFNRKGFIHSCVAFVVSGIVINTLSTYMDYLVRLGGAGRVYVGIVGGSFQLIIMLSSLVVGKYADETRRYYTVGLGLLVCGAFALSEACVRLDEDEGANLRWTLLVVAGK